MSRVGDHYMLETPESLSPLSMEQRPGLDNQQETRNAYIGGLFDGEGTITVGKCTHKPSRRMILKVIIQLVNTNEALIAYYQRFLLDHKFASYIQKQNRNNGRPCYSIQVAGVDSMIGWLELMIPFLIGKRGQAELALQFLRRRQERNRDNASVRDRKGKLIKGFGGARYDGVDVEVAELIRSMNRGSSETTRGPRSKYLVDEKI